MRLGRTPSPDPLRNKKSPWGLLRTALLLGVVVIGWLWASPGNNDEWLGRSGPGSEAPPSFNSVEFEVQTNDTELTLAPDQAPVVSPATRQTPTDSAHRLPPDWLASTQDGRLWLSPAEQHSLDRAIDYVRSPTAIELSHAPLPHVGFVRLNQQPEQYRGQLLEFQGQLWNLSLFRDPTPETLGDEVYEAWLYTPDAGNHPTRVLFPHLPATLQPGQRLDQPVRCAGYFIQRYGYQTATGTHIAPLFVAHTLHPQPQTKAAARTRSGKTWQRRLGELLVVGAASAMLIGYLTRTRPPSEKTV